MDVWDEYILTYCEYNTAMGRLEISYDRKPSEDKLKKLKRKGWLWDRYRKVWYNDLTTETAKFSIDECRLTKERQKAINDIPEFFKEHCGYSEYELLTMSKYRFDSVAKYGTLTSIAKELLIDILEKESLCFLREIYLLIMKNDSYRKQFIKRIPEKYYTINEYGEYKLSSNYGETNKIIPVCDYDYLCRLLGLQQGAFWENLKVFGDNLKPVSKMAYEVSNYRESYVVNNEKTYYKPKTRKEYYLYDILNNLSLTYDDFLTRTIKTELKKEIKHIVATQESNKIDYYLLSIYAYICGDKNLLDEFLDKYVKRKGAQRIIKKIEKQKKDNLIIA